MATAHIYALLAADLPPGSVRSSKPLRQRLLDFVNDTQTHCLQLAATGAPLLQCAVSVHGHAKRSDG